ncbi:MAG: hypothetical protein HYZ53_30110 [Planctomycetes bacterium]|nr:hypothetical protein [Planctomycetota bacterium]
MRTLSWLAALSAACFLSLALAADEPKKEDPKGPSTDETRCDLAHQTKAWGCEKCRKFMEDADLEDGACPTCKSAPMSVLVCLKVAYECAADKVQGFDPGKCPKCGKDLVARKVYAPVYYGCSQCNQRGNPGDKCPTHNELLRRTCLESGTYPHVPRPKDAKPAEAKGDDAGK